jgi:hypothetical protein
VRRKGRGRRPGAAGLAAAPGRAKQRGKKKGKGRGGTDRWGRVVSETKEKKRGRGEWAAAGRSWWAARPPGWKGEKGKFSFFSFSNSCQTKLFKLKFK